MAGYTPVFSSIFDGTLHGKWPQTGVWLALLAMTDRHGCIDRTPQAIASDIGISVDELTNCIAQFMAPDPMSRTRDCEGRRLVLIDPERAWGWRVVNHGRYREKARLQAKDSARTESGADAARKRTPPVSPEVPRTPTSAPSPDSNTNTDSNKKKTSLRSGRAPARARSRRCPEDFSITAEMRSWAKEACPHVDIDRETACFRDHEFKDPHSDWPAVWRQWMRRAPEFKRNGGPGVSREDTGWRPTE